MIFNWKRFRPENTFDKLMHNYLFPTLLFPFSAASAQYSRALYRTFALETNQSSYSGYSEVICDDTCPSVTFVRESSRGICEQVSQYGALIVLFCFVFIQDIY